MKRLLFLLLLASAAFAATSCIEDATSIILQEQGTLIIAVIGLTVVVIAIAYMVGNAMGNPGYVVFAKDEAYHLGFSVLMLVAFSGILMFSCELMDFFYHSTFENMGTLPSGCYTETKGLNSVATCYVKAVRKDAVRLSESYIQGYITELMDSTFSWSITIPLFNSMTVTPGAYRRTLSSQYDTILNMFIIPSLMSISMQKLMLDFINENAIRWILPIAILFRFFIPTRQLGNMLIALAVGLYVIVPFMYVFNLSMYDAVFSDCTKYASAVCDDTIDGYSCSGAPTSTCSNPNSFWNVARLIPQAAFLPNLTIAVLITFLGSMHKALRVIG